MGAGVALESNALKTSKEMRALMHELLEKDPMEVWNILYEMKQTGDIVAFATFERQNKLTCIDVVLDDCDVMVERND